jgi:hypothetical protein
MPDIDFTPDQCKEILQAFRDGPATPVGASYICVGREALTEGFREVFKEMVANERAATKFIVGGYGCGKSLFLHVLSEMAIAEGFVVAKVDLGSDLPFYKFEEVYRKAAARLRWSDGDGLRSVLAGWVARLEGQVASYPTDPFRRRRELYERAREAVSPCTKFSEGFTRAVLAYVKAVNSGESELADWAVAWLSGDPHLPWTVRRHLEVKGEITRETAVQWFGALAGFLSVAGWRGLVLLVDEAEDMVRLPQQRLRDKAYANVRLLWDQCDDGRLRNVLIAYGGTEEEMLSDRDAELRSSARPARRGSRGNTAGTRSAALAGPRQT